MVQFMRIEHGSRTHYPLSTVNVELIFRQEGRRDEKGLGESTF
jgi:hypothetical protein